MINRQVALVVLLILAATVPGCGGVRPVTGGTKGTLRGGGDALADIQVTIHQVEGGSTRPIGLAVTRSDGSFELVTNEAKGPLLLSPGEYRCTLESAGAPLQIPPEYAQPETTPLKVAWSGGDTLELTLPNALLVQ